MNPETSGARLIHSTDCTRQYDVAFQTSEFSKNIERKNSHKDRYNIQCTFNIKIIFSFGNSVTSEKNQELVFFHIEVKSTIKTYTMSTVQATKSINSVVRRAIRGAKSWPHKSPSLSASRVRKGLSHYIV